MGAVFRYLDENDRGMMNVVMHLWNVMVRMDGNLLGLVSEGTLALVRDAARVMGDDAAIVAKAAVFAECMAAKCVVRVLGCSREATLVPHP